MRVNPVYAKAFNFVVASFIFSLPASALIIAGNHGGSNVEANSTAAGMNTATGAPTHLFNRVVPYKSGSAVYLGCNQNTGLLWTITAGHLYDSAAPLQINGGTYAFNSYQSIGGTDIWLNSYHYNGTALNSMPAVNIRASTPTAGSLIVMTGYGYGRNEVGATVNNVSDAVNVGGLNTGYNWNLIGGQERWGVNNVTSSSATVAGYNTGNFFTATFNTPTNAYLTTNEASLSTGDSGGGAFVLNGSSWELAGINSQFDSSIGQNANSSAFNNTNYLVKLSDNRTNIYNITGALTVAPEASSALLSASALLMLIARRKR